MDEVDLTESWDVCLHNILVTLYSIASGFHFSIFHMCTWSLFYFILLFIFWRIVCSRREWTLRSRRRRHLDNLDMRITCTCSRASQTQKNAFYFLQVLKNLRSERRVKDSRSWSEIMHAFLRKSPWEMHWHDLHDNFLCSHM